MKKFIIIPLLFFFAAAAAQEPAILSIEGVGGNGYDYVYQNVQNTDDGGGIIRFITGSDQGIGNINTQCNQTTTHKSSVFRKYDGYGSVEWERCYLSTEDTTWTYLFPHTDGSYILGGDGVDNQQFLIRKEAADGSVIWNKGYGGTAGERLRDMKPCADGGYIMLGTSNSDNGDVGFHYGSIFSLDIWVLKVDSNGNKLWGKVIGGTGDETAIAITIAPNGYYIVGKSSSTDYDVVGNHGGGDLFISRLNDTGHIVWTKCLGGSGLDGFLYGWAVEDGNGGVLVGTTTSSQDGDIIGHNGLADFWMVGLDSNATITVNKCYGTSANEAAQSICKTTDGTIWICGSTPSTAWILHTDNMGDIINEKYLFTDGYSCAYFILPLSSGTVLVSGTYEAQQIPNNGLPQTWYGLTDIFIAIVAPWSTHVPIAPKNEMNVYPNPSSDKVFIDMPDKDEYKVTVTDILGREIYSIVGQASKQDIDVGQWVKGVYHVQVVCESKQYTTRLVVQ